MALVPLESARFNDVRSRAGAVAAGFTLGQKAMVVVAAAAAILGATFFYRSESKPAYGVLFSNLSAADAGSVTAQLQSSHVPFQVTGGGSTILVPATQVNLERVTLAQKGLPSNGTVGFSALDKTGITTSDFVQQVEYQQALEGQLASTIESIQGVQAAKVSLAVPQQSPFAIGGGPAPSASILVGLAPGAALSTSQVQAVVHLTASTVPGLLPSAVTVVDNHGDVLTAPGATTDASTQQQQTQAYDTSVSGSIQSMLDKVLGPGNSAVQVHATMNFDQVSTDSQTVQTGPGGRPVVAPTSQTVTQQNYTGSAAPSATGVLGAGQPALTTTGNGSYANRQTQTTNAVGQVTQHVQQPPGSVTATTVAVLVDAQAAKGISAAQIRSLVAAAAGLPAAQAGSVSVAMVPFSTAASSQAAAAAKAAAAAAKAAKLRQEAEAAGLVLGLLVVLLLAWRTARRRAPAYQEIPLAQLAEPLEPAVPEVLMSPPTTVLPAVAAPIEDDMDRYIDENPDEVARLLRTWSSERRKVER